jgi:hypothetical protein
MKRPLATAHPSPEQMAMELKSHLSFGTIPPLVDHKIIDGRIFTAAVTKQKQKSK